MYEPQKVQNIFFIDHTVIFRYCMQNPVALYRYGFVVYVKNFHTPEQENSWANKTIEEITAQYQPRKELTTVAVALPSFTLQRVHFNFPHMVKHCVVRMYWQKP
jgi:hypothetical protein